MTFFYDLNKRLAALAAQQDARQLAEDVQATAPKSKLAESMEVAEAGYSAKKAAAGKDIGKPGKNFAKIAKSAGKAYGSKERGEKVAGAVLAKLRAKESVEENVSNLKGHDTKYGVVVVGHNDGKPVKTFDNEADAKAFADKGIRVGGGLKQGSVRTMVAPKKKTNEADMDESALQAYLGDKKYGKEGMKALQQAGREGAGKEKMARIRAQHDKMDEAEMDEGNAFSGAVAKAKADGIQKGEKIRVGGKTYPVKEADGVSLEEEDLGEAVSRKHFQAIADTLRHIEDVNKRRELAQHHASAFKLANPRFDQNKFFAAAGLDKANMPDLEEGFADMDAWLKSREKEKGTGKFDKKRISTGTVYTRRLDDEPEDDEEATSGPKKKGRPAGTRRAIGAKGPGVTSKLLQKGAIKEQDDEHVCEQCGQAIAEKAVSKKQQKFMGMVHAAQKGERPASGAVAKVAKSMGKKDAEDFAATKHKGLPEKVKAKKTEGAKPDFLDMDKDGDKKEPMKKAVADKKEKKVDETTTSGSVATAPAAKATTSKGGMQFGKGVYEGFNNQVETMITEGMNITVNLNKGPNGEPTRSISVTADGDDADTLAKLLKMAGLESHEESTCSTCGQAPCGCDHALEENQPDWPTNTETSNDALQYSGGINGPKSTGQTTVPVIASQERRQHSESVDLERSLFKTWKNYKG